MPVLKAIEVCTDMLYNFSPEKRPNIDKDTFSSLAKIASCAVVMLRHDSYYTQKNGLAMSSAPAPHLANGWLSQYEETIKGESKIYFRFMGDILNEQMLDDINSRQTNFKLEWRLFISSSFCSIFSFFSSFRMSSIYL